MQTFVIIMVILATTIWLTHEIRKAGGIQYIEKIDAEMVATTDKLKQAVHTAEGKKS